MTTDLGAGILSLRENPPDLPDELRAEVLGFFDGVDLTDKAQVFATLKGVAYILSLYEHLGIPAPLVKGMQALGVAVVLILTDSLTPDQLRGQR